MNRIMNDGRPDAHRVFRSNVYFATERPLLVPRSQNRKGHFFISEEVDPHTASARDQRVCFFWIDVNALWESVSCWYFDTKLETLSLKVRVPEGVIGQTETIDLFADHI